jgi:hypothetical protein
MSAPTRARWVQAVVDAIGRTLDGTCVIAVLIGRGVAAYMRTCPVQGYRWYWRAVSYGTWAVVLGAPAAGGVVLLITSGWPATSTAAAAWVAASWYAGRPPTDDVGHDIDIDIDEGEGQDEDEQSGEPAPEEPPVDPLLQLAADLIGTARGVHLSALLAALHRAGADPALDTRGLRAQLATRGVPVRPSVRAPREAVPGAPVAVSAGVHREDLEAVLGPLPDPSPQGLPDGVATAATGGLTRAVGDRSPSVATAAATAQPAV